MRAARAAIPNDTPKAAQDDELLAYLVEKHPELPFVKRIIAAIRAFLFRKGLIKNIRPEDVVALAKAAARHAARGAVVREQTVQYPVVQSAMRRTLSAKLPAKGLPDHMRALIELWGNQGRFPWGEYRYSGLTEWLSEQKGEVSKNALLRQLGPLAPGRQDAPAYSGSPLWYSEMAKFIDDKAPGKAPAAQWKSLLEGWAKQGKFKGEELEWSGVKEWLELQQGPVTKDQVLGFVRANGVQVEETHLGGEPYEPDLISQGREIIDEDGYEDEETGEWIDPDPETAEYRYFYLDRNAGEQYEIIGSEWSPFYSTARQR